MLNFQNRGADFKRDVLADVQSIVGRAISGISATVAAQQDGAVISDQHRVINFQGPGVKITDDPANRRANVLISGTANAAATSSTVFYSQAGVSRALSLWNGTANTAPPANWFTAAFDHTVWPAGARETTANYIVGADGVYPSTGLMALGSQFLTWQTFTLPTGSIQAVTVTVAIDDILLAFYVNGTLVNDSNTPYPFSFGINPVARTLTVPIGYFTAGATNTIALWCQNDSNPADIPDEGAFWKIVFTTSTAINGGPYVNVQDQKLQGTNGGGFTMGVWQTRTLNTISTDSAGIASLASNQLTLPAGTYQCSISCPAGFVQRHQARLQNITDAVTLLTGSSEYSGLTTGDQAWTRSFIRDQFILAGTRALSVQHRCSTTNSTNGFGVESNFGPELYTVAEFWKVG
ncbi:MAG: hypothetical protein NVSMB60_08060 [Mycobacterium sp.]